MPNKTSLCVSDEIQRILKSALDKAGSISSLSRHLKVRTSTVSFWFRAGSQPTLGNLRKLERFVNDKED